MRPTPTSTPNTIASNAASPLLISGHEDNHIRYYDLSSCMCIKDMVGHTDSISSLSIDSSGTYVFSGGHDGSVRAWDVRKF
jgi:striatin 1/3/4